MLGEFETTIDVIILCVREFVKGGHLWNFFQGLLKI